MKDWIARTLIAPAAEQYFGERYRQFLPDVARVQTAPLAEIRQHQLARLRQIARQAQQIPLYRERLQEAGIDQVDPLTFDSYARLRPTDRNDVRAIGDYLKQSNSLPIDVRVSATGGTTSAPVTFYLDQAAAAHRWAATRYFDALSGYRRGEKIAYLWGATRDIPHYGSGPKAYIKEHWIDRALFVPSDDLTDEGLAKAYQAIKAFNPRLLQAYPTPLEFLANYLLKRNLTLPLPALTCTAEPVSQEQKALFARAFEVLPLEWYGARDAGRIATECHHRSMHINCYGLYVEVAEGGDQGRLLISDLWNTAMPLLRYDIGDIGVLSDEACACGSHAPSIKTIMGRTADVLINADGTAIAGVTLTNRLVKDNKSLEQMQIIQTALGEFDILLVPGAQYSPQSRQALIAEFNELMKCDNTVNLCEVKEIPVEASGKVRFCINKMDKLEIEKYL